jgi:hypothetical protein
MAAAHKNNQTSAGRNGIGCGVGGSVKTLQAGQLQRCRQRQQWHTTALAAAVAQRPQWQLWQRHTTIKLQPDAVAAAVASAGSSRRLQRAAGQLQWQQRRQLHRQWQWQRQWQRPCRARLGIAWIGLDPFCLARLGSDWLSSALFGSARIGSDRIESIGLDRIGLDRIHSARLGSAWLGSARLGSARLGSARLGLALLGPGRSFRPDGAYDTRRPRWGVTLPQI